MFERFTERARHIVVLSQEEARRLRHNYIGTEHLLLGLIRDEGLAGRTLAAHRVGLDEARQWVTRVVGEPVGEPVVSGQLPLTPRMKKIFELALEDAQALGHNAIGTQHLLIALLHEGQGAALHALRALDAPPEDVWTSAFRQLGVDAPPYVQAGLPSLARSNERGGRSWSVREIAGGAAAGSFLVGVFLGWLIWG
jgi:ATP-dependent Clp protease ATP-binding subunit ClpC